MIQACIFDLDGVIVDTAKYHHVAWNKIALEFGTRLNSEDEEALKGVNRNASLEYILAKANKEIDPKDKKVITDRKNENYLSLISKIDRSELLDNVIDFIEDLKSNNIKIGLGSASKNARFILEKVALLEYFQVIMDGNSVSKSKPDPEIFLKGAEALNVSPGHTVVFEDSSKGIEAALTGGFQTIGIGKADQLKDAHHVIEGFNNFDFKKLNAIFH